MMKKFIIATVVAVILLGALSIAYYYQKSLRPKRQEGAEVKEAIDFRLMDTEGNVVTLASYKDKQPVILFFWNSGCEICKIEMLELNKLYDELKNRGVELLAINIFETRERVNRFLAYFPVRFKVLLDIDAKVGFAYKVMGVPTYVFIDKSGMIKFNRNYFPNKEYEGLVTEKTQK